jgi:hypothetical protein
MAKLQGELVKFSQDNNIKIEKMVLHVLVHNLSPQNKARRDIFSFLFLDDQYEGIYLAPRQYKMLYLQLTHEI